MIIQFSIIIGVPLIGYIMEAGLALPIPAPIIGMLLLLVLLLTRIIKLNQVGTVSNVLQSEISLFILPLGIGLIDVIDLFQGKFLISIMIAALSTTISVFATAFIMKMTLYIIKKRGEIRK